jgi:hypothetical protein
VEEILVNRKNSEFQFIDNKLWNTVRGVREREVMPVKPSKKAGKKPQPRNRPNAMQAT